MVAQGRKRDEKGLIPTPFSEFETKGEKDVAFGGVHNHSLDAKKRLFIPSKLRDGLGDTFVICKGPEPVLFAYSNEKWDELCEEIIASDNLDMQRVIFEDVVNVEVDKQGRITLKTELCKYANLTKEVVVAGVGKRVEIWDKATREEHMAKAREQRETYPKIHF